MALSRLIWIRHGPTHQTAFTGHRDVPADLSDTAALDRLRAVLPQGARVVSSDLIRAVATADAFTGARPRLPHERDLREIHFGDWDGLHFEQIAARDPEHSRAFWERPGDIAAPGGESWNAVAARACAVIDRLGAEDPGGTLIAVAHFGTILAHVAEATGIPPYDALAQRIEPLSLTELVRKCGHWQTVRINHQP